MTVGKLYSIVRDGHVLIYKCEKQLTLPYINFDNEEVEVFGYVLVMVSPVGGHKLFVNDDETGSYTII